MLPNKNAQVNYPKHKSILRGRSSYFGGLNWIKRGLWRKIVKKRVRKSKAKTSFALLYMVFNLIFFQKCNGYGAKTVHFWTQIEISNMCFRLEIFLTEHRVGKMVHDTHVATFSKRCITLTYYTFTYLYWIRKSPRNVNQTE